MFFLDTLALAQDTIAAIKPVLLNAVAANDSLVLGKQTLQALNDIDRDDPSWTDKVQALAAIVGGLIALGAFIYAKLSYDSTIEQQNAKITEQQTQLNALSDIAKNLAIQVNENREKRRLEIRPNLILLTKTYLQPSFGITLENTGEVAAEIHFYNRYGLKIDFVNGVSLMYPQERRVIYIQPKEKDAKRIEYFEFKVYYIDKDSNEYIQTGAGVRGSLYLSTPEYLGNKLDWLNPDSNRKRTYGNVVIEVLSTPC